MQEENFIVREPLLNTQERVLGYEIAWQQHRSGAQDALALASVVAEQLNGVEPETLQAEQTFFIETLPGLLAHDTLCALPANSTVFAIRAADVVDGEAVAALREARARGFGISLRELDLAAVNKDALAQATHVEMSIRAPDFAAQMQMVRSLNQSSLQMVARQVDTWEAYDACVKFGLYAFVGNLHLTTRPGTRVRDLNPAQAMILQLMDMVRKNADVKQLESVLKRDAALSYKLLRYINSAGFGLGCEIQSLKHAVTMLGYSPLYRWLALLLATATTSGYSPALMQTAVIRGRFAELLGQAFLPKGEAENLFVAGMFSLLDKLLGVPMEDVLEKIQLSESVTQALLAREGIYGPFLAMAEACENDESDIDAMATNLCIGASQVNQAHLAALAWAQTLKL